MAIGASTPCGAAESAEGRVGPQAGPAARSPDTDGGRPAHTSGRPPTQRPPGPPAWPPESYYFATFGHKFGDCPGPGPGGGTLSDKLGPTTRA